MVESKIQVVYLDKGFDLEVFLFDFFKDMGSVQDVLFRCSLYNDFIIWMIVFFKKWGFEGNGYVFCDLGDIVCFIDCKLLQYYISVFGGKN